MRDTAGHANMGPYCCMECILMRIDVILESRFPPETIAELGKLAEHCGLGGVWVSSMLDARDPFVNFTDLARQSSRIRMGPIAVSPFELHPLKMATALLTLNEICGGRAQIVIGGGGGTMTAMGLKPENRLQAMTECVEILKMATTGEPINFKGEVYEVWRYHPSWATSTPPRIYVGSSYAKPHRMAVEKADGVMLSDKMVPQVEQVRSGIDRMLEETGRSPDSFELTNFWAWHVKESREEAEREARIWLVLRGMLEKENNILFMSEEDCDLVTARMPSFFKALARRSPEVEGVPDRILSTLVDHLTSTASIDRLDDEIERLRQFREAGLTQIALRIYDDPAAAIRLLGERVVPALR